MMACHFRGKEWFVDNITFCFMIWLCYMQQDVFRDEGNMRALPRFVTAAKICCKTHTHILFFFRVVQSSLLKIFTYFCNTMLIFLS